MFHCILLSKPIFFKEIFVWIIKIFFKGPVLLEYVLTYFLAAYESPWIYSGKLNIIILRTFKSSMARPIGTAPIKFDHVYNISDSSPCDWHISIIF